ncbi:MAG: hypothetical protein CL529_12675 [Aequorivita sp.]|nr:hypothetical protein [Aequorivita sp.]
MGDNLKKGMAKMEEKKEQAFNLISDICGRFQGSLKDHQNIQHALGVLKEAIAEPEQEKKEDEKN